ncbi:MAG TPA: hypothetical protein VFT39_03960 [Vicinamibacterales bacterium]|nr:hypothetical protein [Vicinamibacterales bacterium]
MSSSSSTPADLDQRRLRRSVILAIIAMMIGSGACAANPPLVPVFASRADWEILAGRWTGSYTTSAANRRGLIEFTLSASDEQASGDVLMIAEGTRIPYRPYPPGDPRQGPIDASYTQLLTIRFVRAEQGRISGTIASYWDPDRRCQATATFLGAAWSRAIEGTFTSICEDGVRQLRGTWRVTRQPVPSH